MPVEKISKAAVWIYENLPTQVASVGAAVVHKTKVDESIMNINKDVETVLVACVSALAVFIVRQGLAFLWAKWFPKKDKK